MADLDKLPNSGYFIGEIRKVKEFQDKKSQRNGISIRIDINGNEYYRNIWETIPGNHFEKYCMETGYGLEENIIGKFCVCSKKTYKGNDYIKISSVSDSEYEAFYELQRLDDFEQVKLNTKKEIDELLQEILDTDELDTQLINNIFSKCYGKLKIIKEKRERGNFA